LTRNPGGAGANGLEHVVVELEGGQDHDPDAVHSRVDRDFPRRRKPIEHRHADVHQDDIRRELARHPDRLPAVRGLAHDFDAVLRIE